MDHYLFAHLKPVIQGRLTVPEGFTVREGFSPELSEEQKRQVFRLTHGLYLQYQLIDAYLKGSLPAELIPDVERSAFHLELKKLAEEKKISPGRHQHAMQERAYWAYRLKCYEVMRLVKLNPAKGSEAAIEDYEAEILRELASARPFG
ncbi:MAG: hypothetical protein HC902_08585 [Calothrix sp. SM1_5_4]|nr:hypothetical protein [Calothrix sp. SM1_5_4]